MKLVINIDVPDLDRAIQFYCAAFDLKLNRILDEDVAELFGGPAPIYLLKKDPDSDCSNTVMEKRRYARHWTPVHIDVVVDNLQHALQRALKAGAVRESECVEWLGSKCITLADPFGHGFCLIEFVAESYLDSAGAR